MNIPGIYTSPARSHAAGWKLAASLLLAIAGCCLPCAQAASVTWDASGTGGNNPTDGGGIWSTGSSNWASAGSDAVWTNSNDAVIGKGGTPGTITVSGGVTADSITFNPVASGTYYTIAGGTITMTGSDLITTSAASATISSVLAGTTGLNISGTGALTLTGVETYTGATSVSSGGNLTIGGAGQLGSGSYAGSIADNGSLAFNTSASQTLSGAISGTGSFIQAGTGNTTLSGSNTLSGVATVSNGTLTLSSAAGSAIAGNITFGNGSGNTPTISTTQANQFGAGTVITFLNNSPGFMRLQLEGNNQTLGGLSCATSGAVIENAGFGVGISQNATLTLVLASGSSYSYTGYIRDYDSANSGGKLNLVVSGSGEQTLTGAAIIYTGSTTVSSGTLNIAGSGLGGGSYAGAIADNGALIFNTTQTLSGAISGTGTLTVAGGTLTLSVSNTFSGTTVNSAGTLYLESASGSAIAGNITFGNGSASINPNIITTQANQFGTGTVITFLNNIGGYTRVQLSGDNQTLAGLSDSIGAGIIQDAGFAGVTAAQSGTLTFDPAAGSTYSFDGFIRDTDGGSSSTTKIALVMSGSGEQILVGNNITYTGSTTINSGTVDIQNSTSLASPVTVNGGAEELDLSGLSGAIGTAYKSTVGASGTLVLNNTNAGVDGEYLTGITITGSGALNKTGAGYLDLATGASIKNFAGQVNVLAGCLASNGSDWASSAGQMGLYVASGAYFDLRTGNVNIDALTGSGTIGTTYNQVPVLSVGNNNSSSLFSGVIENTITAFSGYATGGAVALTKNGTGTLTLSGSNTYTGSTTINAGTLTIGGAGVLGGGSYGGSIANNGTLIFASSANQTLTAAVTGSGLTQIGNGTTPTTVTDSGGFAAISGTLAIANGSTLNMSGGNNLLPRGAAGSGNNGSLLVNGTLSIGSGIAETLDSTGTVALNNGTLTTPAGNSQFGAFFISTSQTFNLTGSNTISGSGVIGMGNGSTLTLNTVNATDTLLVSGQIINTSGGGITKSGSGTVTLTGTDTYTGSTTINQGTLQIGNGGATGSISSSSAVSGSSTGTLVFDLSNSGTFGNTISGGIALVQNGSGTETLTAGNSFTGPTTINSGTLRLLHGTTSSSAATANTGGTLLFDNNGSNWNFASPAISLNGGTLSSYSSGDFYVALSPGAVTNQPGASSAINVQEGGGGGSGLFLDGGLLGSGTVTITSSTASVGLNLRNNNSTFSGLLIVNGIASTTFNGGSGLGIASATSLQNADIDVNGTVELGNAAGSMGWADGVSTSFEMGALSGTGVMLADFSTGQSTTVTLGMNGHSGTFSGIVANGANDTLSLVKTGAGTQVLSGANTYTGSTTVNAGTLQIGNGGAIGSIASTSGVSGSSGATLAFDLSGSVTPSYSISGSMGVTQAGTGTLTIGSKSYTGPTTALSGTLIVAGSISGNVAADGGTLLVNNTVGGSGSVLGGTLGGSGTISGNVTVGNGSGATGSSVLWAGAGMAGTAGTTLNTGSLTLNSDADFKFTLNSTEDGVSDIVAVNGKLTLAGAILSGTDVGNTPLNAGSGVDYIIASYTSLSGFFANAPSQDSLIQVGQNWFEVDYGIQNTDDITLISANAPIPEPGTWATVLAGFAMLIGLQRRRASRLK